MQDSEKKKSTNTNYIKVIPFKIIKFDKMLDYFEKINILSVSQLYSVVPILNYSFVENDYLKIIVPKYSYSLQQYIDTNFPNYNVILLIIVKTLQSLHAINIAHLNLKPSNVLFDSNHSLYLSDYMINSIRNIDYIPFYNLYYLSPELLSGKYVTYSSDIWSLGCILYEMIYFNIPYNYNYNPLKVENGIINKLLQLNPSKRISLNELEIYLMENLENRNLLTSVVENRKELFLTNTIISLIDQNYTFNKKEYKVIMKHKCIDIIQNLIYSYNNNSSYRNNILFILIEIFWKSHNMKIYDFISNKLKYFIKTTDSKGRFILIDEIIFKSLTSSYYLDISRIYILILL